VSRAASGSNRTEGLEAPSGPVGLELDDSRFGLAGRGVRNEGPHGPVAQTSSGVEVAADSNMPLTKIAAMKVEKERKLSAFMSFLPLRRRTIASRRCL